MIWPRWGCVATSLWGCFEWFASTTGFQIIPKFTISKYIHCNKWQIICQYNRFSNGAPFSFQIRNTPSQLHCIKWQIHTGERCKLYAITTAFIYVKYQIPNTSYQIPNTASRNPTKSTQWSNTNTKHAITSYRGSKFIEVFKVKCLF